MEIKKKNLEGEPVNVCTAYNVHTISLVKNNALGINILKAKSEGEPQTEEMKILTDKINKAKALDEKLEAEEANKEIIEKAKAEDEGGNVAITEDSSDDTIEKAKTEEVSEEDGHDPVEDEMIEKSKTEEVSEDKIEPVDEKSMIEKGKSEDEESDGDSESAEEGDEEEAIEKSKTANAEEEEDETEEAEKAMVKEEKAKSFTVDELADSHKAALTAIGDLFRKVRELAPTASHWEVFDLIYDAVYSVDDIMWFEKIELENQIWEEISLQVNEKLEKAKTLEVKEANDPVDVMKALENLNPEMAKVINAQIASSKAKAADAEKEKNAVIRQKALDNGSQMYKRIATKSNTTDNIVDALATIEALDPKAHDVVSKALQVSSNILQAGNLFPDVGSATELQSQDEKTYVEDKSKALVEAAQEKGKDLNPAAARATVRQSADYMSQYG